MILVIECFWGHLAVMGRIDAFFVADFIAVFAHGDFGDVESVNEILLVHADLAHLSMVIAFLEKKIYFK